jgi:hypothetical protein
VGAQPPAGAAATTTTLVDPTTTAEPTVTTDPTATSAPPTSEPPIVVENPFPGADLSFAAFLSSGQEVPPTVSTAWGSMDFELAADGTEITWSGRFVNLPEASAAHLHWAPAGENGPVVVPLLEAVTAGGPFLEVEGTIVADDLTGPLEGLTLDALVAQIAAGNIYANVHTSDGVEDELEPGDYPDGEIRGQVLVWTVTAVEPTTPPPTDTSVPDTSVPDTSVPDTTAPDMTVPTPSTPGDDDVPGGDDDVPGGDDTATPDPS